MQHTKRLVTLFILLSVMLIGIMPAFAQMDTADLTAHLAWLAARLQPLEHVECSLSLDR